MPDTVELFPGVRHYETSGFAQTWEAYDALTAEDGWKFEAHLGSEWKRGVVNKRRVLVHAPHCPRPCPECGATTT